jgi:biotin synthase-related radical SAM superfamily protein
MGGKLMQSIKESPQFVQTSLAGAICLGLEKGQFMPKSRCKCLNLLLTYTSGCRAACSYCGLAKNRQENTSKTFIRVKWPTYSLAEILEREKSMKHPFERVCVSMITHGHAVDDTCIIVREVRKNTGLPVSGLIAPTVMQGKSDLQRIKDAGIDRVGIAIDAATEEIFAQHRGAGVSGPHQWDLFWDTLADAMEIFGAYQAGIHLIVGLGESEEEMVNTISRAYRMGAMTHLFSFFPEGGSLMQNNPQPPLGQYRRVQLARYLINKGIIDINDMQFSPEGQIIDFGLDMVPYIENGEAFMTSGCPGEDGQVACNRPFGNERASEPMRNYPYLPGAEDIGIILPQIWDEVK